MDTPSAPNALINETSPYLLQHAHNPVAWQPWGEGALRTAQTLDKPILLSIGYSACHWCHVMAHESFEDPDIAAVMNNLYVCIKVDREERPDLDKIYQAAHNLLAQRGGGWPLTMFLAPDDLTPFFGGTYFPKTARYGLPAFPELLRHIEHYYREHRHDLGEQASHLKQALLRMEGGSETHIGQLDRTSLVRAVAELKQQFDAENGGFGQAPKFPHPTGLRRLLLTYANTSDDDAQTMMHTSLHTMASRGLYDHLEGGFFRYSVDGHWHIPHFEKMLYDNAQLIGLYAEGFAATHDPDLKEAALHSAAWVIADMQAPDGGYYATLDADSGGEEGAFYLWSRAEIQALVDPHAYPFVADYYGINKAPNFENHAYHLQIQMPLATVAKTHNTSTATVQKAIDEARTALTAARKMRPRPGRDEKILTAWNGLMIKGLARAGRLLNTPSLIVSAQRALDFVHTHLWDGKRLAAVTKDGRTSSYGYLDDYAFLLDGILELLMMDWRDSDFAFAHALADALVDDFQDTTRGGFYFTPEDHEKLLYRPKPFTDDALPSGNGVAASALLRFSHLTANPVFETIAESTVRAGMTDINRYPSIHGALLEALEDLIEPPPIIILRGEKPLLDAWRTRAQSAFAPRRLIYAIPTTAGGLPPGLAARVPQGPIVAYVCRGLQCDAPITDEKVYDAILSKTTSARTQIPGE